MFFWNKHLIMCYRHMVSEVGHVSHDAVYEPSTSTSSIVSQSSYNLFYLCGYRCHTKSICMAVCSNILHLKQTECSIIYVTWSDKKGLITHLQVQRYDGFKFLKCCSSPMKAATRIRFSHYLNKFLTFNIIQDTRNQQQSFPPF